MAEVQGIIVCWELGRVGEHLVTLSYQALTGFCRRHGIGHEPATPVGRYHFAPGKEMQHDTSPHLSHIGGADRRVQTASLVLCHSRVMFVQLYPRFTRSAVVRVDDLGGAP